VNSRGILVGVVCDGAEAVPEVFRIVGSGGGIGWGLRSEGEKTLGECTTS